MNATNVGAELRRWWSPEPSVSAKTADRDERVERIHEARRDLEAARTLADQRNWAPAAVLYGRALAYLLESRGRADGAAVEAASSPRDFVAASAFGATEAGRDALHLLEGHDLEGKHGGRRARRAMRGVDGLVARVEKSLYPASDRDARALRIRRRVAAGAAAAVLVSVLVAVVASPRNLARGKPVSVSSLRFGTPEALVNGAIEWGTFGVHTGGSGREWATIDLGDFFSLSTIEVFGRGDGRLEFNLPLHVDLSDDGATFRPAGACNDIFTQATPCVVKLHDARARFVRVSAPEVVLSEVEVYGTR